jgi:hypothetical protein
MYLDHRARLPLAMIAALTFLTFTGNASAANAQQQKMTSCNAEAKAKNIKGEDRKTFMRGCLSAAPAASTSRNSQQEKMKSCNATANARTLKGDARKQFMKGCLSGSQASS